MNNLGDLNGYLFESLARLNNDDLKGDDLKEEMERNKAVCEVAKHIISNGALVLQAKKMLDDKMDANLELPKMLDGEM